MNALSHTVLTHRIARSILVLVCVCLGGGAIQPASAAPLPPPDRALVYVPLPSAAALDRFEATGLPAFAQEEDVAGAYVLAGADRDGLGRLIAAGLQHRILDPDIAGATYYFAMLPPGRPQPDWAAFSTVLYGDVQRLIRTTPAGAERLAGQGVELAQLPLEPIALQRAQTARPAAPEAITPDPLVQEMIDRVTLAAVERYGAQLSGETPATVGGAPYTITTRHTNSGTPIEKATQFVGEHMAGLGLAVEYQGWTSSGYTNRNVIGQQTGITSPGDIYIIGAHLDDMPSSGPAPGADDNASGSAATLIAADILSQYQWGCTLRFALWTGEEQGLLGSYYYASRAKNNGETIRGYLNLDMLGYNGTGPRNVDLYYRATPAGSEQIADTFADVVDAYGLNLVPIKYDVASYTVGNNSDHRRFWEQGYPAIVAIEDYQGGDFTPHYHKATDTLSTLDLDYFTTFVKASIGTFVHMSGCLLGGNLERSITYLPMITSGAALPPGGTPARDLALQAAPPVAPQVTRSLDNVTAPLARTHAPPDTTYTVHRATDPYFTPLPDTQQTTLDMPFTGPISHDDLAGSGNRFNAAVGNNAAGEGAPAGRAAVFDFALRSGE